VDDHFDPLHPQDADAANEARREKEKLDALTETDDLLWLMADVRGRRITNRLLQASGVFRISFTGDNNVTNFNEGKRNEGIKMLVKLNAACPELVARMTRENASHE